MLISKTSKIVTKRVHQPDPPQAEAGLDRDGFSENLDLLSVTAKLCGLEPVVARDFGGPKKQLMSINSGAAADKLREGQSFLFKPAAVEATEVSSAFQVRALLDQTLKSAAHVTSVLSPPVAQLGLTLLPDCQGKITNLLVQCPNDKVSPQVVEAWGTLASALSPEAKISVAIQPGEAGEKTRDKIGSLIGDTSKFKFMELKEANYALSHWSRDSLLALQSEDGEAVVMVPKRKSWPSSPISDEEGSAIDLQAGYLLAEQPDSQIATTPQPWISLAGGNVVSDTKKALVGLDSIKETQAWLEKLGVDEQQSARLARETMANVLGKDVVVLGEEKQAVFHVDMMCTPVGNDTVLVADPSLAVKTIQALSKEERQELNESMSQAADLIGNHDLVASLLESNQNSERQTLFEESVTQLEQAGYRVKRLPLLLGKGRLREPNLTYNNVLMEDYQGEEGRVRKAYVPTYGCGPLDRMALRAYEEEGFEAVALPMAQLSTAKGSLRCSSLPVEREL